MNSIAFILRRLATILSVAVLTLTLIAASSGVLLSFYYQPAAGVAHRSLQFLHSEVAFGWLVQTMHDISGNWVIGVALIQMVVMFLSERYRRSWLTGWITNILFVLTAIGLGWTAMLLNWDQLGFWRFKIELGTIEAIPFLGAYLRDILTGGSVSSITVSHLYTLHSYVLSIVAVILATVHLASLLFQERDIQLERLNDRLSQPVESDPQPSANSAL